MWFSGVTNSSWAPPSVNSQPTYFILTFDSASQHLVHSIWFKAENSYIYFAIKLFYLRQPQVIPHGDWIRFVICAQSYFIFGFSLEFVFLARKYIWPVITGCGSLEVLGWLRVSWSWRFMALISFYSHNLINFITNWVL